jgi:hypothetical protein
LATVTWIPVPVIAATLAAAMPAVTTAKQPSYAVPAMAATKNTTVAAVHAGEEKYCAGGENNPQQVLG